MALLWSEGQVLPTERIIHPRNRVLRKKGSLSHSLSIRLMVSVRACYQVTLDIEEPDGSSIVQVIQLILPRRRDREITPTVYTELRK